MRVVRPCRAMQAIAVGRVAALLASLARPAEQPPPIERAARGEGATFFRGPNHDPQAGVFGDGIKCINPPLFRFGQQNSGQGGNDPFTIAMTAPTELPGSTFHYAIHYRNPIAGFCDPGLFNASNGYTIEW